MNISLQAQIAEIEREIAMRRYVYPRMIAQGKMQQAEADERIARMTAASESLRRLLKIEQAPELPL